MVLFPNHLGGLSSTCTSLSENLLPCFRKMASDKVPDLNSNTLAIPTENVSFPNSSRESSQSDS